MWYKYFDVLKIILVRSRNYILEKDKIPLSELFCNLLLRDILG